MEMTFFQDQSHMNQVRDALWATYGNGASVMVGSGFSRFALKVRPESDGPPLLPDLAREIHRRLYPEGSGPPADVSEAVLSERVLSLAQEYETAFQRTNLHQLLQQLIRDDDFEPGDMHSRLLHLPWRDVFTTNWDTLLERTHPPTMDRSYSIVRDMDEIPLANKPRIVKLHGSLPAQFPLILTEEDYRTYPTKFAPFVNTVQQAMMETVFCLIGFSGNDPNFLNWSGWVRDNLGDSAPRIYLAGWLDLSQHRRRMLEGRGVVPIDLARHPLADEWPDHQRHQYAVEWVLHTLEQGRPYDLTFWPSPRSRPYPDVPEHLKPVEKVAYRQPRAEPLGRLAIDEVEDDEKVKETLRIWSHNRQVYPGWLLFPASAERETLKMRTDEWEPHILSILPRLNALEQLQALRELVWRRDILLEPIPAQVESAAADVLASVDCHERKIEGVAVPGVDWSDVRESWRTVALALLTSARLRFDDDLFSQRMELLDPFANDHPDVYHRLCQERCLQAIYSLDFEALESLLAGWTVANSDPVWAIRKAALLWESGRNDEAAELVKRALESIRSIHDSDGSVAGRSREGWALWSALTFDRRQEFERRWNELAALKCDAMLERDIIARQIGRSLVPESQQAPSFDLGVRRVQGLRFSSARPDIAAYRGVRLSEVGGLPPVTEHSGPPGTAVASDILRTAAGLLADIQPELAIRLVLRVSNSETDDTLNRVLSRSKASSLPEATAESLSNACICVIKYARPRLVTPDGRRRSFHWIARMRVALEILSRLAVRATPDAAEAYLNVGLQCYQSREVSREHWLYSPLTNLLQRSWEALPRQRRLSRAIDLLGMPIANMDGLSAVTDNSFPDPGILLTSDDLPVQRDDGNGGRLHDVVDYLVRGMASSNESRWRAAERIVLIAEKGLLSESESVAVAQALWSAKYTAQDGLPSGTSLYDWMFLLLPEPDPDMAEQRFRLKWLTGDTGKLQDGSKSEGNSITVIPSSGPADTNAIEDVLWNVGSAMAGLGNKGQPLQLTVDERNYIVNLVEHWVSTDVTSLPLPIFQFAAGEPTRRALQGISYILTEGLISESVGHALYEKLKKLSEHGFPCFELTPGLVRTMPDSFYEITTWLRMGLASDDDDRARSAMSGLFSWAVTSDRDETSLRPPPDDMIREVGLVIASRRINVLPEALRLAKWVFDKGTTHRREALYPLVLQGLEYLAKDLQYDRRSSHEPALDLPLLRWLCAQLAQSMAQRGFKDETVVGLWLESAREDPLPEVRNATASPYDESEDQGSASGRANQDD